MNTLDELESILDEVLEGKIGIKPGFSNQLKKVLEAGRELPSPISKYLEDKINKVLVMAMKKELVDWFINNKHQLYCKPKREMDKAIRTKAKECGAYRVTWTNKACPASTWLVYFDNGDGTGTRFELK